jgi:hypothetical protein
MSGPTVPSGPIETAPSGRHASTARQLDVLHEAVRGLPLGAYDEDVLEWLAGCDWPTVATIASLIDRARRAGSRQSGGTS